LAGTGFKTSFMNYGILALLGVGAYLWFKNRGPEITPLEQAWIDKIKATPEWIAAQTQIALEKGIPLEDQLLESAKWVISQGWTL